MTTWVLYFIIFMLPFLPNAGLLIFAGVLGVSFCASRLLSGQLKLEPLPLAAPLTVYIIMIFATAYASITFQGSFRDLSIYLSAFIIFAVLFNQIETKNQLYRVIALLLVSSFIVSLYGIYQYIVGVPMPPGWIDSAQNPGITTRVYSSFGNPTVLAQYLVFTIPLGIGLAWGVRSPWRKILLVATVLTLMATLVLTASRGGLLGLAAGLFFFACLKGRRFMIALLLLALLAAPILPDMLLQRVSTIGNLQDSSNAYRVEVWQEAGFIIQDYFLTGVGLGHLAFKEVYPFYMLNRDKAPYHVHNTFLQIMVETGILGLLIFLWLIAAIFKWGLKSLAADGDKLLNNIIAGTLAATVGIFIQGLVESTFYLPKIIILFWIIIALMFTARKLLLADGGMYAENS